MNRGIVVDVAAIIALAVLGAMRVLEARDVANYILIVVVGRLRPPPADGTSGLMTVGAAALGALRSKPPSRPPPPAPPGAP